MTANIRNQNLQVIADQMRMRIKLFTSCPCSESHGKLTVFSMKAMLSTMCGGKIVDKLRCKYRSKHPRCATLDHMHVQERLFVVVSLISWNRTPCSCSQRAHEGTVGTRMPHESALTARCRVDRLWINTFPHNMTKGYLTWEESTRHMMSSQIFSHRSLTQTESWCLQSLTSSSERCWSSPQPCSRALPSATRSIRCGRASLSRYEENFLSFSVLFSFRNRSPVLFNTRLCAFASRRRLCWTRFWTCWWQTPPLNASCGCRSCTDLPMLKTVRSGRLGSPYSRLTFVSHFQYRKNGS